MANPLEYIEIQCPYCGESFSVEIDVSAGDQSYIEDCRVCCAPAELQVRINGDGEISEILVSAANT